MLQYCSRLRRTYSLESSAFATEPATLQHPNMIYPDFVCFFMEDTFKDICKKSEELTSVRSRRYQNADIMSIFGENATSIDRARHGFTDLEELSYTAAEHHPYWRLLNCVVDAGRIILERWGDDMTDEDMDELRWAAARLQESLGSESSNSDDCS